MGVGADTWINIGVIGVNSGGGICIGMPFTLPTVPPPPVPVPGLEGCELGLDSEVA
jgi:hypothetical protein